MKLLVIALFLNNKPNAKCIFSLLPPSYVLLVFLRKVVHFLHLMLTFFVLVCRKQPIFGFPAFGNVLIYLLNDLWTKGKFYLGNFRHELMLASLRHFYSYL